MNRIGRMVFSLLPFLVPLVLNGQTVKKFYIANDDHTDYMWSNNAEDYRAAFLQMLDYYLDLADTTAAEPSEFQSRFHADGTFWLWTYEKNKPKTDFDRLVSRLKSGHISAPLTLLSLAYGGMPAEAVLRSLYYAGKLERRFGLKFKLAAAQENQSLPYGVGALWAGAGASYFWKGICGCASQIPDAWNRPYDMYWWSGPDGSRLLTKWYSQIHHDFYGLGGYAEARNIPGIIDSADTDSEFLRRVPYGIVGLFGFGGDDFASKTEAVIRAAKQATTPSRKVIVSNEIDFFEDFEKTYGDGLPALGASFGNEWDLLNASMAELSGSVKRGVEKLRGAEALAALVAARDAQFMRGREDARETAWIDLGMYFDHDWTADGPISRSARAAWQRERASGFLTHVETLLSDATAALGRLIRKDGSQRRFFVFNPLSFNRTDAADLDYAVDGPVHVVDVAAQAEVASQFVGSGSSRRLRIWATNVPSLGYKVYEIIPGLGRDFDGGPTVGGNVLENGLVRLTIASNGALTGLADKTRGGREFVRAAAGLRLNELGPGSGTLSIVDAGPVSATLKAESSSPLAHTTFITLYRESDRIEIRNEITQNFSALAQWTFGINVSSPEVWHEEVGAIIKARPLDQGGHYATQALRRDWLTLNHFADMSGEGVGLTISSADNQFFKLGDSTASVFDFASPKLTILAGGQVDGPSLGIPDQGGDSFFLQRFALRTHGAFEAAAAVRFALEHQNPLLTGEVTGGTSYPATDYSFLTIDDPNVVAWSVKPAEETSENRTIVRLWNLGSTPASVSFAFGDLTVLDAQRVTHIETPIENVVAQGNSVTASLREHQWLTFSLALNGDAASGKGIGRSKIR